MSPTGGGWDDVDVQGMHWAWAGCQGSWISTEGLFTAVGIDQQRQPFSLPAVLSVMASDCVGRPRCRMSTWDGNQCGNPYADASAYRGHHFCPSVYAASAGKKDIEA